ncbi:hypothetical protein MTsPCn9_04930 [Croceitalea sp. MTPC9]|uniref:DUF6090 family protein n=1 Tax=unclassified Croceitalea TaxID=2632280 RepID=UPI002B3D1379|nr:hypothetical protein MTsPCn6_03780 [Croceitalea sp. MTPC6]GMN15557.1 hypothetical protein MTsPCn9_04930 [Croceitalea sp. MTPC9]
MIKFFRKIRLDALSRKRMPKYLTYAIGEIVLVVIGILIAIQINNWNEKQKDAEKEQQILLSLREEFKQNIKELEFDHRLNEGCLNAIVALMNFDHTSSFKTKTIDSLLGQMYNYATFDPRSGVINDIISSGNLEIIKDAKLKYALNQWTGELDDYKEDIIVRRAYWINNVPKIMYKYIPVRNADASMNRSDYRRDIIIQPLEVAKENYEAFLSSLEVDSMLFDYYMNQSYVTVNENTIMQFLKNTLGLIEANIQTE